jgi:hypothetical protein
MILFQTAEIPTDDSFLQKPKHVVSNKTDKHVVVTHGLYFLFAVHISQRDVIDKDVVD